jgi:ABC-type antimicrobial peptide transport system permease subunit
MAVKWRDWKMWYLFRTELEPDSDNLVRSGLSPTLAGIGLGLALSTAAVELVRSMLYDVSALDLRTFLGAALLLLVLALASALVPARRAAALDPAEALHSGE